ncbi:MAG TPA: hypothetical protein VFL93_11500 [Longimicrobiaceae bacterium]|nr:hypothetical protein [Longimicrobiaceae bacterium]
MALFGRDYDRLYGTWGTGYTGYDQGYYGGAQNFGTGYGYDRGYYMGNAGYDNNFKSRWQTDNGDPFGDRSARTPMRVIHDNRGYDRNFRAMGYDRNYTARDRNFTNSGYGRDYYSANPMGYEPYRRGSWGRYDRQIRQGREYDSGWF